MAAAYTATMKLLKRLRNTVAYQARVAALFPALGMIVGGVAAAAPPLLAQAQATRTLDGKVVRGGTPVKGAVVHLKDTRTLAQKSYITAEDGSYRFAQLSSTTDYEVWAEADGKKSSTKTVSSFDTKSAFNITLKMD